MTAAPLPSFKARAAAALALRFSATVPDSCGPWNMPTVIIYATSTRSLDLRML